MNPRTARTLGWLLLPCAVAAIWPSDGCTSTQPWPPKAIWMVSPEPRPIRFFILKSVLIDVETPDDHVIAACASANVGAEATLSFLGVGVTPPTPSWGRSIGQAVTWVSSDPWYLIFPGTALFVVTLAFNLFGDGLRDALDPRTGDAR